jgi:hypothetical protein
VERLSDRPPPANAIDHPSDSRAIALTGAYTTAASGSWNGTVWNLLQAPATDGQVCYRWQATPPVTQTVTGGPGRSRCIVPAAAGADPEDTISFPVVANGTGPYDVLGVLLPKGVRSLTLGFVGGTTRSVPVSSPFVWVGPASSTPGYLGVVLADGTKVDSGAGAISSASDPTDDQLTARAASAPWACVSDSSR